MVFNILKNQILARLPRMSMFLLRLPWKIIDTIMLHEASCCLKRLLIPNWFLRSSTVPPWINVGYPSLESVLWLPSSILLGLWKQHIHPDCDIKFTGNVSWVGKTSMEVKIHMLQVNDSELHLLIRVLNLDSYMWQAILHPVIKSCGRLAK